MAYLRLIAFALAFALFSSSAVAQTQQTWLSLLQQGNFRQLEAETVALQEQFAVGKATEFDLREAYRVFYDLNEQDLKSLDAWQKDQPRSYAVRLIRGTYYKRAGFSVRGRNFAAETPAENFAAMRKLHEIALPQLEESLSLTEKPYLSIFHLLELRDGNRLIQKSLLDAATKILATNRLVRARYMRSLTPRWGGSYASMRAFLSEAKRTGATDIGLAELEAIIFDDAGDVKLRLGDQPEAVLDFRNALELGSKVGGEVPRELTFSWYYRCRLPELQTYCR